MNTVTYSYKSKSEISLNELDMLVASGGEDGLIVLSAASNGAKIEHLQAGVSVKELTRHTEPGEQSAVQ